MARKALARLDGVDRGDLRARAFDVIGVSRVMAGDEDGLSDQRRAIEIGRESRALWEVHHATNNLGYSMLSLGRLEEFETLLEEWRGTFEEVGGTHYSQMWFAAARADADYVAGRWDDALARVDEFLAGLAGATHYLESDFRPIRASIAFARNRLTEAYDDVDRAVGIASRSGDPQLVAPSLCLRATMQLLEGRDNAADADFDALLDVGDPLPEALNGTAQLPAFVWLAVDLGRGEAAASVLRNPRPGSWPAVAQKILLRDEEGAADLLAAIGDRPAEARARLRAGGENLARALDFYCSVGATRYIREAETLLAASG